MCIVKPFGFHLFIDEDQNAPNGSICYKCIFFISFKNIANVTRKSKSLIRKYFINVFYESWLAFKEDLQYAKKLMQLFLNNT